MWIMNKQLGGKISNIMSLESLMDGGDHIYVTTYTCTVYVSVQQLSVVPLSSQDRSSPLTQRTSSTAA